MTAAISSAGDPPLVRRWRILPEPRQAMVAAVAGQVLRRDPHFARWVRRRSIETLAQPVARSGPQTDYLFANDDDTATPQDVFNRLRWGGQLVFFASDPATVLRRSHDFHARGGFVIDSGPSMVRTRPLGLPLPGLGRPVHFFVARKVALIPPGQTTDRFTFDVQLIRLNAPGAGDNGTADHRDSATYAVLKQVPTWHSVYDRLRERNPTLDLQIVASRAQKLVDKIFPIFLTREYAMLQLLQRDLPAPYNARVPRALAVEKDERGMVRKLVMNWLRLGEPESGPLSHIEFARQSADLVRVLHDIVRIIHLDLRLDNFVITPAGVGFVDFGSAVRVGENIAQSPMLRSLFDEMMSTSQIQRLLGHMKNKGTVTSRPITDQHGKIDKAIDLFYLSMQLPKPHLNPEFVGLVEYDPDSPAAKKLSLLTDAILRPKNPDRPTYLTAQDIMSAVIRIQERLVLGRNNGQPEI